MATGITSTRGWNAEAAGTRAGSAALGEEKRPSTVSVAETSVAARPYGWEQAHTLMELMIVITVITILAAVGIPLISNSLDEQIALAAADRIRNDIEWARERANSVSAKQTLMFNPGLNTYSWPGMEDPDHPGTPYIVDLSSEQYAAELLSVDFGGDWNVVFDVHRRADSDGQVVVQVGNAKKTITLNGTTGKVSVD